MKKKRGNPAERGWAAPGKNGPVAESAPRANGCPGPRSCGSDSSASRTPPRRSAPRADPRLAARLKSPWLLLPLAGLGVFAALFVGWDILVSWLFPAMSTGLRHALLTAWAGVITLIASATIYVLMRRQQQKLSTTAERLTRLLEAYQANPAGAARFENPHLVCCHEVLGCDHSECLLRGASNERCWQLMALSRAARERVPPRIEVERCLQCDVYRLSCPDNLTELGEAFNNLMFLLEEGAKQVGRMRAQMVEKEKMAAIGLIAAGIAHEIGNPLSSISSIVQMVKRKESNAAVGEELELIGTHIQRITSTVRQLVSFARPSAERWDLIDIRQTLEEAVQLVAFDRSARNVAIDLSIPDSLPQTYGLRGQLQQVFVNLTLNALHAMPDGGELRIRARERRGSIQIRVADNGCGIEPDIGRRVFEPFFTTKEPGQGTGLGLAVSYGIVQKHAGHIDFQSTVGEGTVFTVEIPILGAPPEG